MADHGTHARYSRGCRCEKCKIGHRVYERNAARHRRRVKYGIEQQTSNFVDATEAREHILFLASKGIGLGAIAAQAGSHRSNIQRIKRGQVKKVSIATNRKILAIPAIPRLPMAYTSTEPIIKLLKELEKKGISSKEVGRIMGCRYGNLQIKKSMRVWRYNQIEKICKEMLRTRP
jgi:DNA-binding Xre family transcriptional regulator